MGWDRNLTTHRLPLTAAVIYGGQRKWATLQNESVPLFFVTTDQPWHNNNSQTLKHYGSQTAEEHRINNVLQVNTNYDHQHNIII